MVKEENKMKVILIGKTGAGKTSIAKELEKLGYPRLITDTTRPMREGEKDGVDVLLEVLNPEAAAKFIVEKVKERVKNV